MRCIRCNDKIKSNKKGLCYKCYERTLLNNSRDMNECKLIRYKHTSSYNDVENQIMYETVQSFKTGAWITAFCYNDTWYVMDETYDKKKASRQYWDNLWYLKENRFDMDMVVDKYSEEVV